MDNEREKHLLSNPVTGCTVSFIAFILIIILIIFTEFAYLLISRQSVDFSIGKAFTLFTATGLFSYGLWYLLIGAGAIDELGLRINRNILTQFPIGFLTGAAGIALALGVMVLSGVELKIIDISKSTNENEIHFSLAGSFILILLAAGYEEIILRGLLYRMLRKSTGIWWALSLSSLAFSLFHIGNANLNAIGLLDIFLAGAALCLWREVTGDLWMAWGVHLGWNYTTIISGLPVSGYLFNIKEVPYRISLNGSELITGGEFGPEGGIAGIAGCVFLTVVPLVILLKKWRTDRFNRIPPKDPIPDSHHPDDGEDPGQ